MLGTIKSFGVLLHDITRDLQSTTAFIGLVIGMANGTSYLLSMVNSPLLRRFSPRQIMMVGGSAGSISLILASFARSSSHFATALIMYGAGFSTVYLPANSVPPDYFPNSFEIAASVAVAGGGVGIMVLPFFTEKFVELYGWRTTVMLLGALNLHTVVSASLIKPVKPVLGSTDMNDADDVQSRTNLKCEESNAVSSTDNNGEGYCQIIEGTDDICVISDSSTDSEPCAGKSDSGLSRRDMIFKFLTLFYLDIFRDHPNFITVIITVFIYAISFSGWVIFLIPNVEAKGFLPNKAVLVGTIGGLTNIIGRVSIGFFSAKKCMRDEITFLVLNCASSAAFVINILATSFWVLGLQSAILGFTFGAKISLLNIVVKGSLLTELYLAGLTLVFLGIGIAAPIGGAIMGGIFDLTQSYNIAFFVAGVLDITSGCILLIPLMVECCRNTHDRRRNRHDISELSTFREMEIEQVCV